MSWQRAASGDFVAIGAKGLDQAFKMCHDTFPLGRGRIVAGRFRLCVCVHVCTCVANHALVDLVRVMIGDFVFREFDIEYLFCCGVVIIE